MTGIGSKREEKIHLIIQEQVEALQEENSVLRKRVEELEAENAKLQEEILNFKFMYKF